MLIKLFVWDSNISKLALSDGAVEYTDCFSYPTKCLVIPTPQRVSWYDTKQSDSEVIVMLERWGMRSYSSLPSLPIPLWPEEIVPDRVLSMGQIELNCVAMLNWITWNRTV